MCGGNGGVYKCANVVWKESNDLFLGRTKFIHSLFGLCIQNMVVYPMAASESPDCLEL